MSAGDVSVFSSAILQETAAAKEQLKAIENRHADFLKLEASIREVNITVQCREREREEVNWLVSRFTACSLTATTWSRCRAR